MKTEAPTTNFNMNKSVYNCRLQTHKNSFKN